MRSTLKKWAPKIGAAALSLAMGIGVIPSFSGSKAVRADDEWSKNKDNTKLGTKQIADPEIPESSEDTWRGSYVYFGKYEGEPILFRVLDSETTVYGGKTMLLDSNNVLFDMKYDDYGDLADQYLDRMKEEMDFDDDFFGLECKDGGPEDSTDIASAAIVSASFRVIEPDPDYTEVKWLDSGLRADLNNSAFLNDIFTSGEQDAIFLSQADGGSDISFGEDDALSDMFDGKTAALNDKLFVLDAEDVMNPGYGYFPYSGQYYDYEEDPEYSYTAGEAVPNRIKLDLDGEEGLWWLRNSIAPKEAYNEMFDDMIPASALAVANDGEIYPYLVFEDSFIGVAPALNVDLSKVLFSTVVTEENSDMGAVYKLTVIDEGLDISVSEGSEATYENNVITVPYTVTGDYANRASVLILDKEYKAGDTDETSILFYEALEGAFGESGKFELPSDLALDKWGDEYFVYILAEQINKAEETDLSCAPVKLDAPSESSGSGEDKKTEYTITVKDDGHGTAKASAQKAVSGTEITLTATPADGYKLKNYEVISGGVTLKDNKFTVGSENVEIKAVFEAVKNNDGPAPAKNITYTIKSGGDSKRKQDSEDAIVLKIERSEEDEKTLELFRSVAIDNKVLEKDKDYTVVEGCIQITIKASCLKDLSLGKHNIEVTFEDGSVSTSVTVEAASLVSKVTKTGEDGGVMIYGVVMLAAAAGLFATSVAIRKRKTEKK